MSTINVEADIESQRERRGLALVSVKLSRRDISDLCFERGHGLEVVVGKVKGLSAATLLVDPGYVLRTVNSVEVSLLSETDDAPDAVEQAFDRFSEAETAETAELVFQRLSPPLPPHGWARKALRRESKKR
jgi:hypothetical protein